MTDKNDVEDDAQCAQVLADSRARHHGAVPGAQPKLLTTQCKGRFYLLGCTPPEVYQRWHVFEDLAKQLSAKSVESKAASGVMSEVEILDQYLRG